MFADGARLLLEVWDTIPDGPKTGYSEPDDESGRGLRLVDVMAGQWGWTAVEGWPKKVVAQLRLISVRG
jgi:hypothetical protein